jgi:nucleotide-binding universal stress UspA family protein
MTFRTILMAASGGSASAGATELACRLAQQFKAHLEGFHVRLDPYEIVAGAMGGESFGLALAGDWIDQIKGESAKLAHRTRLNFETVAASYGLTLAGAASMAWREETGHAPAMVAARARFFDLAVLGRSERAIDRPHTDAVEETLLQSGRPVLLAPAQVPETLGNVLAIGWNGSAQAVRALSASLPFLGPSAEVVIVTIGEAQGFDVDSLRAYLAWHGVKSRHQPLGATGEGERGPALLSAARQAGAGLLALGGYGHRPWREILFGGATREVLDISLMPLLLAH